MTNTITAQQARNTKIFVIENGEVVETTLFEFVCESAEETTSPRGVDNKLFIKERTIFVPTSADEVNEGYEKYTWDLREWMPNGKSRLIDTYESQEAADDEWFDRTYRFDFLTDDQRDTMYWNTREEAEAEQNERMSNQ